MKSAGFDRPASASARTRTPVGINVGLGTVVVVAASFVAATVPATDGFWRVAVVALALAGFAFATVDVTATAVTVVVAWLVVDGFLVNRLGELSWAGRPDLYRAIALLMGAVVGLTMGSRRRSPMSRALRRLVVSPGQALCEEEETRDA